MRAAILAVVIAALAHPVEAEMYKGYETPDYTVEARVGAAELRAYGPRQVAEVRVSGGRKAAVNAGFGVLARYIFGGNDARQKIAMTTPVTQTGAGGDWTVEFMLPSGLDPAALPRPDDARIRIRQAPAERLIVLGFGGVPTDAAIARAEADLRAIADGAGLTVTGDPVYRFYDSPMTLPWTRRNEVAFALK